MNLTTTSYAVLGYLAVQPWSMYDLAAEMRRNVHYFFPRAESQVYAEPKRLVQLGLAQVRREMVGKRLRSVYSITENGSAELKRWLAAPVSKGPTLEFEALLRVFLAPCGTDADLASTLAQVRREIGPMLAMVERISREYLTGEAPFQRHVLTRSMVHEFLGGFADLVDQWAARSATRMAQWETQSQSQRVEAALETFRINTRGHGRE